MKKNKLIKFQRAKTEVGGQLATFTVRDSIRLDKIPYHQIQ